MRADRLAACAKVYGRSAAFQRLEDAFQSLSGWIDRDPTISSVLDHLN
jgi:hypothetical protein